MSEQKGMVHYRAVVKEEAVRLYLEEGLTYQAIAMWDYRKEGALGSHKVKCRPRKKDDQAAYITRLEMENALLKNFTRSYAGSQNRSATPGDLSLSERIGGCRR